MDVPGLAPSIQDRLAAHGAIAVQGGAGALPPDGPLPPARLVAVVAERPEQLAERHLLTPVLARALAPHVVALPPLVDRAEDLRALLLDALARAGMRAVGSPIGLDPAALGRLVEHPWPGNEAELEHVVAEAVAVAQRRAGQRGGVPATVTSEDLDAIGILPPADPTATPVPVAAGATRRRRTSRRPRR